MDALSALTSCLLLVGVVTAQSAHSSERLLPQWLTGLIAVSGFLFLAFVSFLVKRAWCEESSRRRSGVQSLPGHEFNMSSTDQPDSTRRNSKESEKEMHTYETSVDMLRIKDNLNAYNNLAADCTEERPTAM